jgi:hypothetical protein
MVNTGPAGSIEPAGRGSEKQILEYRAILAKRGENGENRRK